jgi:hypothetical protein
VFKLKRLIFNEKSLNECLRTNARTTSQCVRKLDAILKICSPVPGSNPIIVTSRYERCLVLYILRQFEKFVDWRQCIPVMHREVVTVMPSYSGGGNVVVALEFELWSF